MKKPSILLGSAFVGAVAIGTCGSATAAVTNSMTSVTRGAERPVVMKQKVDGSVTDALKAGGTVEVLLTVRRDLPTNSLVKPDPKAPVEVRAAADRSNRRVRSKVLGSRKAQVHVKAPGLRVIKDWPSLPSQLVAIRDQSAVDKLAALPEVSSLSVIPDAEATLTESLPLINQPTFIANGDQGDGATVAVLDTGVDYTKAAFGKCKMPGPTCRVSYSADTAPDDNKVDDDGHGTNVSGIVAGTAPKTKLAVLDIFKKTKGDNRVDGQGMADALQWVLDHRSEYNIVAANMSVALRGGRTATECATASFAAEFGDLLTAGVIPIVSAGNSAYDGGKYKPGVSWPACLPGAVTVGATYDKGFLLPQSWGENKDGIDDRCTDKTTSADKLTCFSQGGDLVDLVAPGAKITAAGITESGTSQAAPHVAGAVALLAAKYPDATVTQIADSLRDSATQVPDLREKALGNDISYPRLDLTRASLRLAERLKDKSISDGVVQLGVNEYGALIAPNAEGGMVGLRYIPTDADAVTPGCFCEGWGVADMDNNVSAYTNQAAGTSGVTPTSYTTFLHHDGVIVEVNTSIGLKILHAYTRTSVPGIYKVDVEIHNTGTAPTGTLVYRRVVDWDVPPTTFNEYVTSLGSGQPNVRFVSDDGFASSDPLAGPSQILASGDFTDSGPDDHGTLMDIQVGVIDPGAWKTISLYYGAGADETSLKSAMASLGVATYSTAKPAIGDIPETGSPNTFVIGYKPN